VTKRLKKGSLKLRARSGPQTMESLRRALSREREQRNVDWPRFGGAFNFWLCNVGTRRPLAMGGKAALGRTKNSPAPFGNRARRGRGPLPAITLELPLGRCSPFLRVWHREGHRIF
jgi:hypothetical protein